MDTNKKIYACEWLKGGLTFHFDSLCICCILHNEKGGYYKISDFSGGDLPVDKIVEAKKQVIEQNNSSNVHPSCKGCSKLKESHLTENNYMFNVLNFSHFTSCNLKCKYCYLQVVDNPSSVEGFKKGLNPMSLYPTIKSMIEKKQLAPYSCIHWGGGEPTLLKDFNDIMDITSKHNILNILNTNATIFSKKIYDAFSITKTVVQVSLDSGSASVYNEVKGKDYFDKVCENIKKYSKALDTAIDGSELALKYIFLDENSSTSEIDKFIDFAKSANVTRLVYDINIWEGKQKVDERCEAIKYALIKAKEAGLRANFGGACGELSCPNDKFEELKKFSRNLYSK